MLSITKLRAEDIEVFFNFLSDYKQSQENEISSDIIFISYMANKIIGYVSGNIIKDIIKIKTIFCIEDEQHLIYQISLIKAILNYGDKMKCKYAACDCDDQVLMSEVHFLKLTDHELLNNIDTTDRTYYTELKNYFSCCC